MKNQLVNSDNRITELRNQINGLNNELNLRGERIAQLNKIIEEKTNSLIKLENIEDTLNATVKVNEELNTQLSRYKEDIDKLDKQLEEKTSKLAERTHALRVFRRALYDMRLYVQPYKKYELDFEWLTIRNSIDSGFFIRFKDTASAARAIGDCRYYISLKDVLDKYENDIVDFNVSAMDIYYIHKASPNVVRKFNYYNFNISCKDQRTANTINTLLNCSNISVYDIMDRFKDDIAYSNTHYILSLLFGISIIYCYTCTRITKFKIMYDEGVEFPICSLVADIDYLDCEMANNWNTGNTLSEDNIDLDLDITHIED